MRVAVVGAGIVGVHVAVQLARGGADVTVLDGGEAGGGTTSGSFAWIDASHPSLAPYLELRLLGLRAWQRQAVELGRPPWLSLGGTRIWTADPHSRAEIEAHAERLRAAGFRPQRRTVAAALASDPDLLVADEAESVYRFEGEGWVRTAPAVAALLERGQAAGLRARPYAEVRAFRRDAGGRIRGVVLDSGEELHSDVVISCAGRWTQSLLSTAGVDVPMLPPDAPRVPGLVVRTTPIRSRVASVVLADGLLIRPDSGGRLLLHSDALDRGLTGTTAPPEMADELLAQLAPRVRGAAQAQVQDAWVCLRALPADLLPVVGWALDGLYVVATHSGVTLAPALGELVAGEVIDGRDSSELARFRPGRFAGSLA
jgi:D-hydroxyproline dehydrogenase subunit beta